MRARSIAGVLPRTRNELYAFLALLVAIIGAIIAYLGLTRFSGLDEAAVKRIVDEAIAKRRDHDASIDPSL